jgi:hypothetical protein
VASERAAIKRESRSLHLIVREAKMIQIQRCLSICVLLTAMVFAVALSSRAQDTNQGPIAPPPKFEVKRIPSIPHPGPPPIPEQEIIQKFAAAEDVAKKVYADYSFTQSIRVEELNNPGGKFTVSGTEYTKTDGNRYWRTVQPPESTLKMTSFRLEDVHTMIGLPLFFLTTEEIGNYTFLYAGQDKLDDLNTYVFQVKPKQLSRTKRYFEGAIWIDDHDLAIVKTYGKFVGEISGNGTNLPFTMFETYRENFQEKYWLPTYTNSDEYINKADDVQLHLRLVIHSTDFKISPPQPETPASATDAPSAVQKPSQQQPNN